MLTQLHIKNFALIDDLTLEFSGALNVLTGETGAGKSILIDAIRFVLGERLDALRAGSQAKASSVEAAYELSGEFFKRHRDFEAFRDEDSDEIVLRREMNQGKTRCWINNRIVTLSNLKNVSACLIDIHGQYDHQFLLDSSAHLVLLDQFARLESVRGRYRTCYEAYRKLLDQKEELERLEAGRERELDLLKYQIDEIERAGLEGLDEEELLGERARLMNAEKLYEITQQILAALDESDANASSQVSSAVRDAGALLKLDPSMEALKKECEEVQISLEEVIHSIRSYREELTFDEDRLSEVDRQMDAISLLSRKYGGSLKAVFDFLKTAKEKFEKLSDAEFYKKEIDSEMAKQLPPLKALAGEMTKKRKQAAAMLKREIERELRELAIQHARFEPQFEDADFSPSGSDRMEFFIGLNPGQPVLAMKNVISGGEISRVMLAAKKALMKVDPVPVLIFDEIDTNIGGRLGQVTGTKLKSIAGERQVLLVTHLPQIASFADRHIKVSKSVSRGTTTVSYEVLEGDARVQELAQMMSGKQETEISRKHAKEMIQKIK